MSDEIFFVLDLFGTMVFAITGAVKGVRNRLDFLGVIVFAITVGCAGGMIRDTLLGATPVSAFTNGSYVLISAITGIVVFFVAPYVVGKWKIILYADALGLGVFTVIGVQKAFFLGLGPVGIVLSGVLGAIGGGVLRDVFSKEIPMVLKSDFYATASIIGALLSLVLVRTSIPMNIQAIIIILVVVALRVWAIKCNVKLPVAKMVGEDKKDLK